jgi:hypothetical protein
MTTKKNKPMLIKCGKHFINPDDVSSIRNVKNGKLWIVKFKSEPNPEFGCFLDDKDEIAALLKYFDIKE